MKYFIIELQNRDDGVTNVQNIVVRQTLATALSYYYSRCSAMAGTELYPTATLILIDNTGKVYENKFLTTAYVAPEVEE